MGQVAQVQAVLESVEPWLGRVGMRVFRGSSAAVDGIRRLERSHQDVREVREARDIRARWDCRVKASRILLMTRSGSVNSS